MKEVNPASGRWHLDKGIPVAVILSIVVQAGIFLWYGGGMSVRLEAVEAYQKATAPQGDRLTRVEVRIENIAENIVEIRNLLRQRGTRP